MNDLICQSERLNLLCVFSEGYELSVEQCLYLQETTPRAVLRSFKMDVKKQTLSLIPK